MKTKCIEQEKVGLMLASGFSKKQIAMQTGKSINTVSKETDNLFKRTGCHNLADITRFMVNRYTGIAIEDVLIHAMHDLTVLVAAAFLTWCALQPETLEKINASLSTVANILTK
jgi:DNA-binding CsgD family transcriptional regulator